jgi:putative acetyltransferase
VIVRPEAPDDREASVEVERAAFGQPLEAQIVEAVRDEPGSFALVAELEGELVGHVQMSRATVGQGEVLALGPIGVLPVHQRHGIGTALVAAALTEAGRRDACAVILLGDPAYYRSRGFEAASGLGWRNPFLAQSEDGFTIEQEHFQVAILDRSRAAELAGDVRWHPAFG